MGFGIPVRNGLGVGLRSYATLGSRLPNWSPALISTALWLDAADANTITLNGSTVSQWNDKSGNGRNATQATAIDQPTYTTAGLNSKNIITFDGLGDKFNLDGTFFVGTPYHFAVVAARAAATSGICRSSGGTLNSNLTVGWNSSTAYTYAQYGNDFSVTVPAYTSPQATILGHNLNTTSGRTLHINGSLAGSTANTTTLVSNASWILGSGVIGGNMNGYMAEVVATTTSLDTETRQKLEGYLAWKWGLEANLPVGHPYKSIPPTV